MNNEVLGHKIAFFLADAFPFNYENLFFLKGHTFRLIVDG